MYFDSLTVGGVTEIRRVKDKCNFFFLEFSIWKDEVDINYNGKKKKMKRSIFGREQLV